MPLAVRLSQAGGPLTGSGRQRASNSHELRRSPATLKSFCVALVGCTTTSEPPICSTRFWVMMNRERPVESMYCSSCEIEDYVDPSLCDQARTDAHWTRGRRRYIELTPQRDFRTAIEKEDLNVEALIGLTSRPCPLPPKAPAWAIHDRTRAGCSAK